jgi:hypothetical protein
MKLTISTVSCHACNWVLSVNDESYIDPTYLQRHDCVNGCRHDESISSGQIFVNRELILFRKMYLNIKLTLQTQGCQSPPDGEIDYDVGAGRGAPFNTRNPWARFMVFPNCYSFFSQQKTLHLLKAVVDCANTKRWTSAAEVLTKIWMKCDVTSNKQNVD